MSWAILLLALLVGSGIAMICWAICACPTGQVDEILYDPLEQQAERESQLIERKKRELEKDDN